MLLKKLLTSPATLSAADSSAASKSAAASLSATKAANSDDDPDPTLPFLLLGAIEGGLHPI